MILLHLILSNFPGLPDDELLEDVEKSLEIFSSMNDIVVARRCAEMLREVLEVTRTCLARRRLGTSNASKSRSASRQRLPAQTSCGLAGSSAAYTPLQMQTQTQTPAPPFGSSERAPRPTTAVGAAVAAPTSTSASGGGGGRSAGVGTGMDLSSLDAAHSIKFDSVAASTPTIASSSSPPPPYILPQEGSTAGQGPQPDDEDFFFSLFSQDPQQQQTDRTRAEMLANLVDPSILEDFAFGGQEYPFF